MQRDLCISISDGSSCLPDEKKEEEENGNEEEGGGKVGEEGRYRMLDAVKRRKGVFVQSDPRSYPIACNEKVKEKEEKVEVNKQENWRVTKRKSMNEEVETYGEKGGGNKLGSLEATLVRNYDRPTYLINHKGRV